MTDMTIRMYRSLLSFLLLPLLAYAIDQASIDFLRINSEKEDVKTLFSGLQYKILKKGPGQHHPTPNSPCSCHYEGRFIDGKVFESSYDNGSPVTIAPQEVIQGWTEAMQLMQVGDKFELYIPPELAYGDEGAGKLIPGGAVLIFQMEMLEIKGDKLPALTCDPADPKTCSDKENAYVAKMRQKSQEDLQRQMMRLVKTMDPSMDQEKKDWIMRRSWILKLLTTAFRDQTGERNTRTVEL
eukprot:CAMPEP_0119013434 /NCGR_PEP_ID=MMETSP1176-20130426/8449_1 /TAXON_ID=265551 /ORGANISM="Synedropsis recta cf, Strain CCMP1620" /LENGTH=239 /DNA_ID=CAMNT_0006966525 /DNA_START=13 /DNA_END=732 /DNA_ORIENTATION=-